MTSTKMFSIVFDEEMKSHGYKRKGRLYIKLKGEIIYTVFLRPLNPYDIHFFAMPYWAIDPSWTKFPLNKGFWAEGIYGSSLSGAPYSKAESEEVQLDYMRMLLRFVKEYALPFLDKFETVYDFVEGIEPKKYEKLTSYSGFTEKSRFHTYTTNPSSFGEEFKYLDKYEATVIFRMLGYEPLNYILMDIAQKDGNSKKFNEILNYLVRIEAIEDFKNNGDDNFSQMYEKNDFSWITKFKEEQKKILIPKLRDELGLDTSHL